MKVLFLTTPGQDNLEDATLHGLRALLGADCVDWPRKDVMYEGWAARPPEECYGNLFTLWRTLDEIPVDRTDVPRRLAAGAFDLVVVGSVHRLLAADAALVATLPRDRTAVLDGDDHAGLAFQALRFLYFKRELAWKARLVWYRDGVARWRRLPVPTALLRVEPFAFSIPAEKVVRTPPPASARPQRFPRHIVDAELRALVTGDAAAPASGGVAKERGYHHSSEADYYADLRRSVFGITTKRGGWDCLRHYELAANGAIVCFRDLRAKPRRGAPHGLDATNAVDYPSAAALLARIERLTTGEQDALIAAAHRWALGQTTAVRARELLDVTRRRLRIG